MTEPSKVFEDCGLLGINGGVSLGDVIQREGGRSFHADLPGPVRRGGLVDEKSRFDPATGSGQITQVSIDNGGHVIDSLRRTFATTANGHAVVNVVAHGRRVAPFGDLKVWRVETAPRQIKVDFAAGGGQVSQRLEFQGQELGELVARKGIDKDVDTVMIQWRPGLLDRARRALESIQRRLVSHPAAGLPAATDGVLYSYQDPGGRVVYKIGGPDAPWLSITNELTPPGDELAFRFGAPNPQTGLADFYLGKLAPRPESPLANGGPPQWIAVTAATADHPGSSHPGRRAGA